MSVIVRPAEVGDADGIGAVHVASWQWAYAGLMPAEILASLSVSQRSAMWRERLAGGGAGTVTFVADDGSGVVGFVTVGPSRDEADAVETGELYAVYLLAGSAGVGLGRVLHDAGIGWLESHGFSAARLWVLTTNERARVFYERQGWTPDGATKVDTMREGNEVHETRYSRQLSRQT